MNRLFPIIFAISCACGLAPGALATRYHNGSGRYSEYQNTRVNMSCDSNYDCYTYVEWCDPVSSSCQCAENSKFDPFLRGCRRLYCFEDCTEPGYECTRDLNECRLCWTQNNEYLCGRPREEILWPVFYASAGTLLITVCTGLLIKLCCCCGPWRRRGLDRLALMIQQTRNYQASWLRPDTDAVLVQSQCPVGRSDPAATRNPFTVGAEHSHQSAISTRMNIQHSMNISSDRSAASNCTAAPSSSTTCRSPASGSAAVDPDAQQSAAATRAARLHAQKLSAFDQPPSYFALTD